VTGQSHDAPARRAIRTIAAVTIAILLFVPRARAADEVGAVDARAESSVVSIPQRDVSDLFRAVLHRSLPTEVETQPRPGLSITALPSVGYNPSYGAFIGASLAIAGWLGDPSSTSLSSGSVGGSYSTTGQISFHFKSDFFLPQNTWALKGDWRYLDTSQDTYGLGSDQTETAYPMDFVLYRLYQTVYRRVNSSSAYFGLGYHFDRYDQIHDPRAELGEATPFSVYSRGTPSRTIVGVVSQHPRRQPR
jgi:hypothetical protein